MITSMRGLMKRIAKNLAWPMSLTWILKYPFGVINRAEKAFLRLFIVTLEEIIRLAKKLSAVTTSPV